MELCIQTLIDRLKVNFNEYQGLDQKPGTCFSVGMSIMHTVHPNEIVDGQGPPSVDHEESDRKVNQAHTLKPSNYTL